MYTYLPTYLPTYLTHSPTLPTYQQWRQALELVDEAVSKGLGADVSMFNDVMAICVKAQRPKETVAVLDRMARVGR